MKPIQIPLLQVVALFALTGFLAWYTPLPDAQVPPSIFSKMSSHS